MALDGRSKESSGRREEVKTELPSSIESGKLSLRKAEGLRSSSYLARLLGLRQASARFFSAPLLLSSPLSGGLMVLRSVVSGPDFFSETPKQQPQQFAGEMPQEPRLPWQSRRWGDPRSAEKASPCTRIAALIARF